MLTSVAFREHPAEEVYVTGTFDDWSKSEKLEKVGDVFAKDVTLPSAAEKIYYKVRGGCLACQRPPKGEVHHSGMLDYVLLDLRNVRALALGMTCSGWPLSQCCLPGAGGKPSKVAEKHRL